MKIKMKYSNEELNNLSQEELEDLWYFGNSIKYLYKNIEQFKSEDEKYIVFLKDNTYTSTVNKKFFEEIKLKKIRYDMLEQQLRISNNSKLEINKIKNYVDESIEENKNFISEIKQEMMKLYKDLNIEIKNNITLNSKVLNDTISSVNDNLKTIHNANDKIENINKKLNIIVNDIKYLLEE